MRKDRLKYNISVTVYFAREYFPVLPGSSISYPV